MIVPYVNEENVQSNNSDLYIMPPHILRVQSVIVVLTEEMLDSASVNDDMESLQRVEPLMPISPPLPLSEQSVTCEFEMLPSDTVNLQDLIIELLTCIFPETVQLLTVPIKDPVVPPHPNAYPKEVAVISELFIDK